MIISSEQISPDALEGIIKEFILREGTEYGSEDISLEDKISQVRQQLTLGAAVIVYSELHETVNIMPIEQFNQQAFETTSG